MARLGRSAIAVALAATLGIALAPTARPEQSLAEAARRERERRAASRAGRTYTDSDLAAARPLGRSDAAPPSVPTPEPPAASASEASERTALEKRWRDRFVEARRRLADADARAFETVVEPVLVGDGKRGVWVPMQVRKKIATEELRQARQALTELEEELRVAGLPPGWGRE